MDAMNAGRAVEMEAGEMEAGEMDVDDPERRVGRVYHLPPQPPIEDHTTWIPAGVLEIGVEWREVQTADLEELYRDSPQHLEELRRHTPAGGFRDEGVSLHVRGASDGFEHLRFDAFADEPHYHYLTDGEPLVNRVVHFDPAANDDFLAWSLDRLRTKIVPMLQYAAAGAPAEAVDVAAVNRAVDLVEEEIRRIRRSPPAVDSSVPTTEVRS